MNGSDPWRYRCPNGHADIRAWVMSDIHGKDAQAEYYCKTCQVSFETPIDAKTGEKAV